MQIGWVNTLDHCLLICLNPSKIKASNIFFYFLMFFLKLHLSYLLFIECEVFFHCLLALDVL